MNLLKDDREVFTVKEVSEFLRVHKVTILRHIKKGDLGAFNAGGKYLITKLALKQFMRVE